MAKFEKCNYNIACMGKNSDDSINVRNVDGYSFLVPVNGAMVKFCTHRDTSGCWEITDFATGFKTTGAVFNTRKGAFEHATSEGHIAALEKYLKDKPNLYAAQAAHFTKLLNGEKFTVREYRESVEKMRDELTKAQQTEKKEEKSMTDTKKNTKSNKKNAKRPRISGWIAYGTTSDGMEGWLAYSPHKTNKGAENWLKRVAKQCDDVELTSVTADFVEGAKERDEKEREVKATLKKLCDKVVTWTGSPTRKTGLKSTWTAKNAAPKPPKNAAQPKPEPKPEAKPEPKPEAVTATATAITLEVMREWCNERTDVIATQKREGAIVRISGESKPYKEELKELGFKWSKKGFWWARPTA